MKFVNFVLVGVIALLQAMAPLLHAHLGADRASPARIHLHVGSASASAKFESRMIDDLSLADSLAVGVGLEMRRDVGWTLDTSACVSLVRCETPPRRSLIGQPVINQVLLPQAATFLTPQPQAPPASA